MLNRHLDRGPISGSTRAAIFVAAPRCHGGRRRCAERLRDVHRGAISDEQGRGVQGVAVVLVNDARQANYEVKSNANGRFEFVGLPAGEYALEAKGSGFQPLKETLTVGGQNLQRSYTLKLGTLQETITLAFNPRDTANRGASDTPSPEDCTTPEKSECAASPKGGRIQPPKKIRDAQSVLPIGAARCLDGRHGEDGSPHRHRWLCHRRQTRWRSAARSRAIGDRSRARMALYRDVTELRTSRSDDERDREFRAQAVIVRGG